MIHIYIYTELAAAESRLEDVKESIRTMLRQDQAYQHQCQQELKVTLITLIALITQVTLITLYGYLGSTGERNQGWR